MASETRQAPEVAVLGGGIAGLAAAWDLVGNTDAAVTVFEASPKVGGKLRSAELGGIRVDVGAESMLAARPEAVTLASQVGLQPSVVHPQTRFASVLSRGALRVLPTGLVSGVPTDMRALAASRILSLPGLLRIPLDQVRGGRPLTADVSVGEIIAERLGREVVERLAEPLLAGVYAGDPYELSLQMANPSLFRELARERSLLNAARATLQGGASQAGARRGPVFAGLRGGVARLARQTADALAAAGARIRTDTEVTALRRTARGWQVMCGSRTFEADAVVLAVPAQPAARLLRTSAPFAAAPLMSIEYASVAVVTLAYPASRVGPLAGSGFLVPPVEGLSVKGVTFSSNKWQWLAGAAKSSSRNGKVLVRASLGRYGDEQVLERGDEELARLVATELFEVGGLPPQAQDYVVTRWANALPQYRVGHVDLVTRARDALVDAPGVALAGAAYDGVGVASCIASGQQAARSVRRHLSEIREHAHG